MGDLTLVLGGARSGKSDFALALAGAEAGEQVLFVATAAPGDEEMARRIARHRTRRPAGWTTLEVPRGLADALPPHLGGVRAVVVDCLTLLVSNLLAPLGPQPDPDLAERAVEAEVMGLLALVREAPPSFIVVSNEVGLGLVPTTPLGRLYRDLLGQANRALARAARRVYLLVAGLPLEVKGRALPWPGPPTP